MKSDLSVFALAAVLVAPLGCNNGAPTAPLAAESVPVTVNTRTLSAGETSPDIHLSTSSGTLVIRVTRQAFCATIVTAAIDREPGRIALVSHVGGDPAAACVASPATQVVDYTVRVGGLTSRTYRVNVFEGVGDGAPKYLGTVSISL